MVRFLSIECWWHFMVRHPALKKAYMIALAVIALLILLAVIFRDVTYVELDVPKPDVSEQWTTADSSNQTIESYPTHLNVDAGNAYVIHKTIPASQSSYHFLVATDHQDIVVKFNDVIVYSSPFSSYSIYASLHHVFSVTNDSGEDGTLSITYQSPYQRTSGLVMPIYEVQGSASMLYGFIVFEHMWQLGFGILFVLIGLIALAISHVVDQSRSRGRFYLAMFAVVFGLYIISRSTLLQFVTNNAYILGGVSLTLFMILPIPILLYYKGYITTKYENVLLMMIGYYGLQAFIVTAMQFIGILDFYQPSLFVQVMMLLGMSAVIIIILLEVLNGNNMAKKFSRYYGILYLYGFISFVNEQTFNQIDLTIYSLAVLALLAIIILIDYIFFIEKRLKLSYRSEDYARLAYMDRLTGSKNRHAYEEDFERFFSDERLKKNLRLVFFDFDGLKIINDQYGHVEGDFVLKEGFTMILNAFGRYGECYRIGGDEFACIIQSLDDDLYVSCKKRLVNEVKVFSSYHKYDLHISVGTSIYKEDLDNEPNQMIIRADQSMYKNKKGKRA